MSQGVPVSVVWSPAKTRIPTNGIYTTMAFFPDDASWPNESWSVRLRFDPADVQNEHVTKATAEFLNAEAAPAHLLAKGASFAMLEGKNLTALVVID